MALPTRRTVSYLGLVAVTTLAFTVVYNAGMAVWESRPQPLYHSVEVVFQTFTTTGYGEDAPWQTPQMHLLVVLMQITGIGLVLTAVDVFAVPWLRDALSPTAPDTLPERDGHVVICGHTPRTDVLITELDDRGREYVLVESDSETAGELHEAGYDVIHGDPESTDTLARAQVTSGIAVVTDVADDMNASIALSVYEIDPEMDVVSLVTDSELAEYHRIAGASTVLSPRQLLGERLAGEVPTTITTAIEDGVEIGRNFELVEISVEAGSDIHDETFAEVDFRDRFGVDVVGAWFDGEFETRIDPDAELDAETRLLVAGESTRVGDLRDATAVSEVTTQEIILAGYGDTGQAASEALAETDSTLTVLDIEDNEGVDVVGDARDPDVLRAAGIGDASVLILTIQEDTAAIFTTLIARELNPDIRILVRASEAENVQKLYRAGGDYVQSLAAVSGRMLASTVFEDEDLLVYDRTVSIVQLPASELAGQTVTEADVRTETGCTVVAVIRNDETITEFDPAEFRLADHDEVVIAGTEESVEQFERQFAG